MSRKKNLSPTASLASCLNFAARVLSSAATVQEICTKAVLAPMVVEAHRYGQQVMKQLEPGVPADARKLIMVLRSEKNNKLCRENPLMELSVGDLTWDFEGTVADTLDMELEELESRAAMNTTDTCVVFSALSQASGGGQAVIWFPLERNGGYLRDVDGRKKPQILLYVCPGRVKVVKSMGDLIKKMYDELPALREHGAKYNVWAVIMGSRPCNQLEELPTANQVKRIDNYDRNQCMTGSVLKASSGPCGHTPLPLSVEDTNQLEARSQSTESRVSAIIDETIGDFNGYVKGNVCASSKPQGDGLYRDELLMLSPRFSVNKEVSDLRPYSSKSIFSFGLKQRVSLEQKKRSFERALDRPEADEACKRDKNNVKPSVLNSDGDDDNGAREGQVDVREDNQHQGFRSRGSKISASLDNFAAVSNEEYLEAEDGLGLGVRLHHGFAWRSCDGKVIRRSVWPQRPTFNDVEPTEYKGLVAREDIENDEEGLAEALSEIRADEEEVIDDACYGVYIKCRAVDDAEEEHDASEVVPTDQIDTAPRETREHLPLSAIDKVAKLADNNWGLSPRIFKSHYEPSSNQAEDDIQTCVDYPRSLDKALQVSSSVDAPRKVVDSGNESPTAADTNAGVGVSVKTNAVDCGKEGRSAACVVDSPEHAESPTGDDNVPPVQKLKPAVNFRDKLGARVWWELEYIAKRLEREEMMERQQKGRQWQDTNQLRQGQRPPACHLRQMQPTMRSKKTHELKQNGLPTASDEIACDDQPITIAALEPTHQQTHSEEEFPPSSLTAEKYSLAIEVMQSRGDEIIDTIHQKISPCKTVSSSKSQKKMRVFKVVERVAKSSLSLQDSRRERDCTAAGASPAQEFLKPEDIIVVASSPAISSTASLSNLSELHESGLIKPFKRRQLSRIFLSTSAVPEFIKSSVVQSRESVKPASLKPSNLEEEEDEAFAHKVWGSTHTCYERDRSASIHIAARGDELQTTEITSAVPFTICGRVPMRYRRSSRRVIIPATDGPLSSSSDEHSPFTGGSHHGRTTDQSKPYDNKPSARARSSGQQASTVLQTKLAVSTPPPVATFIALGEDNPAATSTNSRQDRLNELRHKKLQKLQQTRDLTLLQQKRKLHQRQVQRPLSFANSIYSKKASNRQLIQNALEFTLLAGGSMEKERTLALQALAESICDNFVVLLKSPKELKFRALYENHVDRDCAIRIYSVLSNNSARAPPRLGSSETISQFFKYSSAKKQFLPVPTRSFTVKTDACALVDELVFRGKSKNNSSALALLL